MNTRKLKYLLHSGKNPKFLYYAKSALLLRLPLPVLRPFCTRSVAGVEARRDYGHIADRVDYYCRLRPAAWPTARRGRGARSACPSNP